MDQLVSVQKRKSLEGLVRDFFNLGKRQPTKIVVFKVLV